MRTMLLPVEVLATFTPEGLPAPVRFRLTRPDGERRTVNVDRITERTETNIVGARRLHYCCRSDCDGVDKVYELTFEVGTLQWWVSRL